MAAKCPICGAPLDGGRCGYCGYEEPAPVQPPQTAQPQIIINNTNNTNNTAINAPGVIHGVSRKNKLVALLLCIFLGCIGAHKFYVGKVGGGIVYLFTAGLFGIGWVIDIFLIAIGAFKDEFGLPLRQ